MACFRGAKRCCDLGEAVAAEHAIAKRCERGAARNAL